MFFKIVLPEREEVESRYRERERIEEEEKENEEEGLEKDARKIFAKYVFHNGQKCLGTHTLCTENEWECVSIRIA